MSISKLTLKGKHNIKNTMAATLASQLLNVRSHSIQESLTNFEGSRAPSRTRADSEWNPIY